MEMLSSLMLELSTLLVLLNSIQEPAPEDIWLKIADLGFARFLQDDTITATLCG